MQINCHRTIATDNIVVPSVFLLKYKVTFQKKKYSRTQVATSTTQYWQRFKGQKDHRASQKK